MPQLTVIARTMASATEARRLRREGYIPFVLYSKGKESEIGAVSKAEFDGVLRNLQQGFLPTTVFDLVVNGKVRKAIVKDIQYKATTYDVIHLDFLELFDDQKICAKVPVEYLNTVDCVGVKAGGFFRVLLRHVNVSCLPVHLPSHFQVDVKDLGIKQLKRVSDIQFPANVQNMHKTDDILVTVVKR